QGVQETDGKVMVKVTRPASAAQTFAAVSYTTLDGTAISSCGIINCSADYVTQTNRLVFYPGQTELSLTITIKADRDTLESAETFTVRLSRPLNASLNAVAAKSTITILRQAVIPATTKAVDAATANALTGYAADGTLTFSQSTPLLDSLQPNHVLVSSVHAAAPSGFLRRVVAKTVSPTGQVTVTTVQASLGQAIQDGGAVFSRDVVLADAASITLDPSVTLEAPGTGARSGTPPVPSTAFARLKIDKLVVHDADGNNETTSDQVMIDGTITLDPIIDFNFDMGWFELDTFKFNIGLNEVADIKVRAPLSTVEVKLSKEPIEIFEAPLKPIIITVGFVPLVFEPEFIISVNAEGSIKSEVVFTTKQTLSANAGIEYVNEVWNNLSDISNEVVPQYPTLSNSLDVKAFARLNAGLKLYGIVGPSLTVDGALKLAANPTATPWWKLDFVLTFYTKVDLTVFDQEVVKIERVIYEKIWPLLQAETSTLERVSVDSAGAQGNGHSYTPDISADGRYTVFPSAASNLVPGDTNGKIDIFLRDKQLGTITLISKAFGGSIGNGDSREPKISADGRFVVFSSEATNLVAADSNNRSDAYLYSVENRQVYLVSAGANGVGNSTSWNPEISDDGSTVVFLSASTNLAAGDSGPALGLGYGRVFLRNLASGQISLVSRGVGGAVANHQSNFPRISANGQIVVFQSKASNLISGDTNGFIDYFVYTQSSGQISIIGTTQSALDYVNGNADISANGAIVAFSTPANVTGSDSNGVSDIYLYNLASGQYMQASLGASSSQPNGASTHPRLSADGTQVAFLSEANNLVAGDANGKSDVYVRNLLGGTTLRLSVLNNGTEFNDGILNFALSADGRHAAWQSAASNIVAGDTNGMYDIFAHHR
ncbi:MAG TPA: Calx-beta domain-containing protein, partial [Herpetosiphonaceae bacterium]|nr:Calx-beta domain-containing protein [Herpetosiphonaceae bacterium]